MCHNPVPTCFVISWSPLVTAGHHWSQIVTGWLLSIPYCSVCHKPVPTCFSISWSQLSQGGHRTNLMPDLESAQNSGSYNPVETCFTFSWSHLVTGWSQVKSHARFGIRAKFWYSKVCHNPVPTCFVISWSQDGNMSVSYTHLTLPTTPYV